MPRTDVIDADGLCIPEIVSKFPRPIAWLLKKTYCPLLSVEDTMRERLLKSYVFVMVPMSLGPIANGTLTFATTAGTDRGITAGAWGMASAMLLCIVCWALAYFYVRLSGTISEWTADGINIGTLVVSLLMCTSDVDTPHILAPLTVVFLALIAHTPRTKWVLLGSLVLYFLGGYNNVIADANRGAEHHASEGTNEYGLPLLTFPGPMDRDMWVKFLYYPMYAITVGGGAIGVWLRLMQADDLSAQSEASAKIAARMAQALTKYDTKRAEAIISQAREDDTADPDLLDHFEGLVANLDAYRPHLPNWVVASTGGESDAEDELDIEPSLDRDEFNRSFHSEPPGRSPHSGALTSRSETSNASSKRLDTDRQRTIAEVRTVSLAVADLTFAGDAHGPRLQPHLDATVDLVHRLARTYGAVHSFVGDRVTVSWNAASRVANPQAKAARFLVQLAKHAGDGDLGGGTLATGATASGPATAHVAGLGDQRALFLSARGEWGRELEALRAEAARQGGGLMLCDERTRREAEHSVAMRAQAAVEYAPKPAAVTATPTSLHCLSIPDDGKKHRRRSVFALATMALPFRVVDDNDDDDCPPHVTPTLLRALGYALLGLRDDGNDEWMYVLEGQDAQSADVKAAEAARLEELQQWVRGQTDTTAALAVLGRVS